MKTKLYLAILLSHVGVLLSMLAPLIQGSEIRQNLAGATEPDSYFLNAFEYIYNDVHTFTSALMIVFMCLHAFGIVNAIIGMRTVKAKRLCINLAFIFSFASSLMGALQLHTKSYVLFAICAASFLVIAICSIVLLKREE